MAGARRTELIGAVDGKVRVCTLPFSAGTTSAPSCVRSLVTFR